MENSTDNKSWQFQGVRYLMGFLIGAFVAVLFVAITGVEALIGAIAASVSIPVTFALEKQIQGKKFIMAFFILGVVLLAACIMLDFI